MPFRFLLAFLPALRSGAGVVVLVLRLAFMAFLAAATRPGGLEVLYRILLQFDLPTYSFPPSRRGFATNRFPIGSPSSRRAAWLNRFSLRRTKKTSCWHWRLSLRNWHGQLDYVGGRAGDSRCQIPQVACRQFQLRVMSHQRIDSYVVALGFMQDSVKCIFWSSYR